MCVPALAALVGISVAPRRLSAQPAQGSDQVPPVPEPTGAIPSGFRRYQISDMTAGMRDDTFTAVAVNKQTGTIYVGTGQGRIYKHTPGSVMWDESTVVPQLKELYGFAGQRILFGHLRSDDAHYAPAIALPRVPLPPSSLGIQSRGVAKSIGAGHGIAYGPRGPRGGTGSSGRTLGLRKWGALNLLGNRAVNVLGALQNQVATSSMIASLGGGGTLGAGLSARAPRLGILLRKWHRPPTSLNLKQLLATHGVTNPAVWRIVPHPDDPNLIFAGTANGLYTSYDGGVSWIRTFAGTNRWERGIHDIAIDPSNHNRIFIGTSQGMFVSEDRGNNWAKSTRISGGVVSAIKVDPRDPRYIYVATNGGVWRSNDGGESFAFIYYSTLPKRRDVRWIELDPFDPNTAYLATADGVMVTHKLRTATSSDWKVLAGLATVDHVVPIIRACTRHPGHLYIMTRADLPTVNYGADGPEVYILESWDAGKTWRVLMSNQTQGDVRWFTLDPNDPDRVYVAWRGAISRLDRIADGAPAVAAHSEIPARLPGEPSMSQVLSATLKRAGLRVDVYEDALSSYRERNWLPSSIAVTGFAENYTAGGVLDDQQFAQARYLNYGVGSNWGVMAWATWNLPELFYKHDAIAMIKLRVNVMNDEVRNHLRRTIHRNYGELQRLEMKMRVDPPKNAYARAIYDARIKALRAIVDFASGGYLSRYEKRDER